MIDWLIGKEAKPRHPYTDDGPAGFVGQGGPEIVTPTPGRPATEFFLNQAIGELNHNSGKKVDVSVMAAHAQRATALALMAIATHLSGATIRPEEEKEKK